MEKKLTIISILFSNREFLEESTIGLLSKSHD